MLFKNPNLLWLLFLLIIPILVHLLQLRKWKTQYFTNVKLLQQLQIQSQKSSKLKKWLLLTSRLLFLIFVILAFAQPFFPSKINQTSTNQLVLILDNSHSMAAKTSQGVLFKKAIEAIIDGVDQNTIFDLYCINEQFQNKSISLIKQELLRLDYYPKAFRLENILNQIALKKTELPKDIVVITDGLNKLPDLSKFSKNNWNIKYYIPKIQQKQNVSIDSVFLTNTSEQFLNIGIKFSVFGLIDNQIPIAIYNNNQLKSKLSKNIKHKEVLYVDLPKEDFHGYIEIEDNALAYDNRYYFTTKNNKKINILSVGSQEKQVFLKKIFNSSEANLTLVNQFSTNILSTNFDVIILNEVESWSQEINVSLQSFVDNGGSLIIIPHQNTNISNLQSLTQNFGITWKPFKSQEQLVQKVIFDHPLFKGVFKEQVTNFAYPKVEGSYEIKTNLPTIMAYANGNPFLVSNYNSQGSLYVFSAPLHEPLSNIKQTPLIVPTLYNMVTQKNNLGHQTAWLLQENPVFLNIDLSKNQLVNLENGSEKVIPIQQALRKKLKLTLTETPINPGNFSVVQDQNTVDEISLNVPRSESDISQQIWLNNKSIETISSIGNYLSELKTTTKDNVLWKWFVSLGLFFLVCETIIQKFIK